MAIEKLIAWRNRDTRQTFYARRITSRPGHLGVGPRVVVMAGYFGGSDPTKEVFIPSDELFGKDSKWEYQGGRIYES